MRHKYAHFIPQNVAPKGATRIVIKDGDGNEVSSIPASRFGGLTRPAGEPLYSFGLVSDCHTADWTTNHNGNQKLRNALAYFQNAKCKFVIGCGDFTQAGFYYDGADDYDEGQMLNYRAILDGSGIPVHELFGNHENYYASILTDIDRAKELTDIPYTAYTVSSAADSDTVTGTTVRPNRYEDVKGDLFILVGQSTGTIPMSTSDLDWLENILAAKTDKRCLVFFHTFIDDNWGERTTEQRDEERAAEDEDGYIIRDSGNPCGARGNAIAGYWEDSALPTLERFLNVLRGHPNVVAFHGHSHMMFESQEMDKAANYTAKNGFRSVHVPSLGNPRTLLDTEGNWTETYTPSQCYLVEVYADCIVLNGLSFSGATATPVPLGTYKIDT